MEAIRSSGKTMLAVLLAAALALAGLGAYAAFSSTASALPQADSKMEDVSPIVKVESGVIKVGECFVTTQKVLEGPVLGEEERFEPRRNADGLLIDKDGNVIPLISEDGPPIDPSLMVFDSLGFFDVLREIEIIKTVHACAVDEGGSTAVGSEVQVHLVKCTKAPDLSGARCETSSTGVPPEVRIGGPRRP